jgi:methionyl-tRNA formyltransferase
MVAKEIQPMKSKRMLRIAALSSTAFGHRCLQEGVLVTPGVELVGILTTPPKIDISYSEKPMSISTHTTFNDIASQANCEVVEMHGKLTAEAYLNNINHWRPDFLLALGWYYMIPRKVRDSTPLGCAGIHASLLPRYRGGAPITWVLINGETQTGISFFYMAGGVDNGNIIKQESFSIEESDTCATLYEKAMLASTKVLREYLPRIAAGTAPSIPQDETQATYFPQRKPEDGLIDWSWNAKRIKDFIRAQTRPYPGAFTYINGKKVILWDADVVETIQ